jgi:ACS family hexuronate transporter-like MFS transporter
MCAASIFLPTTPSGPWLRALWLVIGMGALGVFPCYYSFVQGLSERHPAKVFGILSASAWYVTSLLQPRIGLWIDQGKAAKDPLAFDRVLAVMGVLPLVVAVGLWVVWRERKPVRLEVGAE